MSECFEVLSLADVICIYLAQRKENVRDVEYFFDPEKRAMILKYEETEEQICQKKEEGVVLRGFDINGRHCTLKEINEERYQVRIESNIPGNAPRRISLLHFPSIILAMRAYNGELKDAINLRYKVSDNAL